MTRLGDETTGAYIWQEALLGKEIVNATDQGGEVMELTLDDGTELRIDASLDCCAHGEVHADNVVGGKIMSVSTDGERDNGSDDWSGPDSVYRVFIMKDGLPGTGTITVNSYESSGYYGTGYTLYALAPQDN